MKDQNMRHGTIKILQKNTGSNFSDTSHSNFSLGMSPEAGKQKQKQTNWDYIKTKSSCTGKKIINKTKRQSKEWEKAFVNYFSDKGLLSKIYKDLIKYIKNL